MNFAMAASGRGHWDVLCGVWRMWISGGEQDVWIHYVPWNMHCLGTRRYGDDLFGWAYVSGAHFNPAVTITFAILASGALYVLVNPKPEHFYGTTPVGSAVQSFVLEIIISFFLMFVVSGVSTDTRAVSTVPFFKFFFSFFFVGKERGKRRFCSSNYDRDCR